MSLKAITVNTPAEQEAHILAQDDAAIYQSIVGSDGVFNIGNKFAASILSNNSVRVSDGVLCVGGHIARTAYADYQDMVIENGASGQNRNDIIVAKFQTSGSVDTLTLEVKKGTPGSAATDPALTQNNLYQGGTVREYPLWRVKLEGLSITDVEQMYTEIPTIPELLAQIKTLNTNLGNVSGRTNTIGYINSYGDKAHAAGITASTTGGTTNPVIVYDGNELHVPRALEDNNNGVYRVRDICAVLSGSTWYLRVVFIHPTGVQTRYIPLQSSIT